jgi:hypothetical protein
MAQKKTDVQRKVAPDSLRVSYFYKSLSFVKKATQLNPKASKKEIEKAARKEFRDTLGSLFIPAWTQLTAPLGLTAYVPSVPPVCEDVPQVPDEIAIVFFESQAVYTARTDFTGGRVCGPLHNTVFGWDDPVPVRRSNTQFPKRMPPKGKGELNYSHENYTPYYLFDNKADWYFGQTDVYVGVRPDAFSLDDYPAFVQGELDALRKNRPEGLEGLLFIILQDCFIFWAHWDSVSKKKRPLLVALKKKLREVMDTTATPAKIPASLSDEFKGIDVKDGDSFAIQFERR